MMYKRYNLSETNLERGMLVNRNCKDYKTLWCIYRIRKPV